MGLKSANERFMEQIAVIKNTCRCCRFDAVEILEKYISDGIDINHKDADGNTPILLAIKSDKGFDIICFLIRNGANVNDCDHDGYSVLMLAIYMDRDLRDIKFLIDAGADLNKIVPNQDMDCHELLEMHKGINVGTLNSYKYIEYDYNEYDECR
jgi:ankyrin repeat protein